MKGLRLIESFIDRPDTLSCLAQQRMLSRRGEPLFLAEWVGGLMVHFEIEPTARTGHALPLDLFDGRAFVSLSSSPRAGGGHGAVGGIT